MPFLSAHKFKFSPPEANVINDINSPLPIVLITHFDDYVFNEELLGLKEWIAADMVEYTWGVEITETHFFGQNTEKFQFRFNSSEWDKFDNWVKSNPPKLYFKRELLERDITDTVKPIAYPCYEQAFKTQSREEFNARPIELFHFWGRSHEARVWFHSNAYKEDGITLIDNLYYIQGYLNEGTHKHIWASVQIPHFARLPLSQLLTINNMSKLSLSMPGAGKICFRSSESPVNSVMVMQDSGIAFPHRWVHGENCIMYKGDDPIPAIKEALQRDDLYDIYLRGLDNIDKYRPNNYNPYLENLIKAAL